MTQPVKAFVYVEAQASVPFEDYPWDKDNPDIRDQPGFISKTWLSGADNHSIGGFYAFDSLENAKRYATGFMSDKAKKLNIGITTRVFAADRVADASREMNSPFFDQSGPVMTEVNNIHKGALPDRMLYIMIRVTDLDRSVTFYRDVLGMREVRRETFTEGQFTLVFMGYSNKPDEMLIELTYNWGERSYEHGTGYGHLALEVEDIFAACDRLDSMGVKIIRDPGPMTWPVDETGHRENIAFIEDPDGYQIELVEAHNQK